MPIISARYGSRDSVMDYPARVVLFTLQKDIDDSRMQGWQQKNYQKRMEDKAKSRR